MKYLLDTNVLSEPVKPRPNPHLMRRLEDRWEDVVTAAPAWSELLYGCRRLPASKRRRELEHYLGAVLSASVPVLPYDERAADRHATERARLEKVGRTPAFVDGQIAAVAWVHGLVLVTANVNDFEPFEDVDVEDWTTDPST